MKIVDPILFAKNFVPMEYLRPGAEVFDFADMDNSAGEQLFNEVVGSLSAAFSNYTNDPSRGNRISKTQGDQIGFAQSLSQAVEEGYTWKSGRGLEIVKVAITAIEYDEDTKKLLSDVKKADALSGARGNSFMQQSVARGFQAAGENGGGAGMAFMGMGMNAAGNVMGGFQQPVNQQPQQPQQQEDPYEKLAKLKKLLDDGVISQEEFDEAAKDGQNKCPKCGATDISLNPKNGKLRCNFCRHEFEPEKLDAMEKDISKLEGEIVGSGATNIIADTNDMVTFKCSSCGAEVVVDTAKATQARCHWCRNTLYVNQQIPNGAVPDKVLPFSIPKKRSKGSNRKICW